MKMTIISKKLPDQVMLPEDIQPLIQSITIENSGVIEWPFDTYMVFSGNYNQLQVPEEIYVGALPPNNRTSIDLKIFGPSRD